MLHLCRLPALAPPTRVEPVVQPDGRTLSIITVGDVIDVCVQESTEDVLRG